MNLAVFIKLFQRQKRRCYSQGVYPRSQNILQFFFHRNETGCFHKALPSLRSTYDKVSRKLNNGETKANKLITRPIMTVTSPNSPHIALTYTKMRFDNFFDQTYPPSWSKLPKCIESGVVFLFGQKSNQNSRISTAKFYYMTLIFGNFGYGFNI